MTRKKVAFGMVDMLLDVIHVASRFVIARLVAAD